MTLPVRDEVVDFFRCQVVVVAAVQAHHRCELARAEALDLLVAEEPFRRNRVRARDGDRLFQVLDDLVRPAQGAAEVGADVEMVLAGRCQVKERVEGRDALDVTRVKLQGRRDLAHRLRIEISELLLREVKRGHDRGARLRVPGRELLDLRQQVR